MAYFKENLKIALFTLFNIPMLFRIHPKIIQLDEHKCVLKVKLKRFNKNHLGGMYFGALASGAETCAGVIYMGKISDTKERVTFAIKSLHADFLKAARSDAYFTCDQVQDATNLINEAIKNPGKRVEQTATVNVTCPDTTGDEIIAQLDFVVTIKNYQKTK